MEFSNLKYTNFPKNFCDLFASKYLVNINVLFKWRYLKTKIKFESSCYTCNAQNTASLTNDKLFFRKNVTTQNVCNYHHALFHTISWSSYSIQVVSCSTSYTSQMSSTNQPQRTFPSSFYACHLHVIHLWLVGSPSHFPCSRHQPNPEMTNVFPQLVYETVSFFIKANMPQHQPLANFLLTSKYHNSTASWGVLYLVFGKQNRNQNQKSNFFSGSNSKIRHQRKRKKAVARLGMRLHALCFLSLLLGRPVDIRIFSERRLRHCGVRRLKYELCVEDYKIISFYPKNVGEERKKKGSRRKAARATTGKRGKDLNEFM